MSMQVITPELRRWILEQADAGVSPEQTLAAMRSSGWEDPVSIRALEETLQRALGLTPLQDPNLPKPVPVPEPAMQDAPTTLWAGDREVGILLSMKHPRIVVFGGLLSDEECEAMIALSESRLARSETVTLTQDGSEVNSARTSDGMFFDRGENELCQRIETRLANLLNWPLENGEGLQVLRYRPGAEYLPHYDYFDPQHASTATILKRGGQRVGTVVMYLNTPERGGSTIFPDIGLEVMPVRGNAVFFSYDKPHPSTRTLHGGSPVQAGQKWVATKWMREGLFE
ncbi:2OG-Fe(II) oxygenase [Pelomonas sp. SE-A7]|uniref:2OG-Fe(II) oxygenase n=1 Tax=Pelomonas sp. SE-A7 TaxID=3054953 RepID=UPI00259CD03E|nr:2OG-Fe(II) oxygenase [Pelomonas sp. SE-A7]MDM4764800.1 2OG-Fe(II) oxygenase [Pelomonas sp. SE-A7]